MSAFDRLIEAAGSWRGTNRLFNPHSGQAEESDSTAEVAPLLGGRFIRIDYTWSYQGAPQQGSMLFGRDRAANGYTYHWIDSWHMSDGAMNSRGAEAEAEIDVRGTYAAPPGPDWGWRTVIRPGADSLDILMFNVSPDGQEYPAVEAEYRREV